MRLRSSLLALSLTLVFASSAAATVMVRASVEALTRESERVALGTVRATEAQDAGPSGQRGIYTRVSLDVQETWRGPHAPRLVFWVHGGRVGERAMQTHGQASFAPGERVLVFLDDEAGALFPTGMSQGKWLVEGDVARSNAAADTLVTRRGRALVPVAPLDALPLRALETRVRSVR